MKSLNKLSAAVLLALSVSSCRQGAVVTGSVSPVPVSGKIEVKMSEGASMVTKDSLLLAEGGSFKYKLPLRKSCPEFVYLYKDDVKLATLLLSRGDRVKVKCDTVGNWTVEGSEECETVRQNEFDFIAFSALTPLTQKAYVQYYQKMTKFIFSHSKSLSVLPVLYQQVGDFPVFGQVTDALIFEAMADSLSKVYPDSRYVKMLRKDAAERRGQLTVQSILDRAQTTNYVELKYPDISGKPVKLSSSLGKSTLLVFWDATDGVNKMFNLEILKPLYEKYAAKGLKIYQVNLGTDKATWAMVVREQKLPWINVCDTKGSSALTYGLEEVPSIFLLTEGNMERLQANNFAQTVKNSLK